MEDDIVTEGTVFRGNISNEDRVFIYFSDPIKIDSYDRNGAYYRVTAEMKGTGSAPQVRKFRDGVRMVRDGNDVDGKFVKPVKFDIYRQEQNHSFPELFYYVLRS